MTTLLEERRTTVRGILALLSQLRRDCVAHGPSDATTGIDKAIADMLILLHDTLKEVEGD